MTDFEGTEPDQFTRALVKADWEIKRAAQAVEIADAKVARRQIKLDEAEIVASSARQVLVAARAERRQVEQERDDAKRQRVYAGIRAGKELPGLMTACRSAIRTRTPDRHEYCDEELCACPCHKEGDELP
jgi:hypothetical protein